MKRTFALLLAAIMLTPGESFAQAVSAAGLRGVTLGSPAISLQSPVPFSALVPSSSVSPLAPAALTPTALPPAPAPSIAVPVIARAAALVPSALAAAPLIQAQARIAKSAENSAPALEALFDGGLAAPARDAVDGVSGSVPSALAPSLGAPSSSPSFEPRSPKDDSGRAPWRRKVTEYKQRFVSWVSNTPSEILLIGVLGLAIGLGAGHKHESDREKHIPLAFSEIHQIERDAERAGMAVGPLTRYLTSTSDMTMKVFEVWNESHANTYVGSNVHNFATELEYKMDPSFKFHRYEIFDFVRDLPAQADAATAQLSHLDQLRRGLSPVVNDFNRSWDDSHTDHYRTEYYTVTVDDGKGKSHTETRSREVYDHTTHTYTYDRASGERASTGADALIARTGSLALTEVLHTASQTNAEGEYAAEKSRRNANGGARLSQDSLTKIANTWATGSTLMTNLPEADRLWAAFHGDANAWRAAKGTAHDDRYNTGSHADSGPREFQTAERALADGAGAEAKLGEILDGISFVKANTPKLEGMIRELIDVELHYKKDGTDTKKLMREILTLSQQMYQKNFNGGLEVDPYRKLMLLVYSLCGLGIGAALGAALDKASRKYRWY
ncbi:MAG: hypothetical protein PHS14_02495 [Elusimicrobia bacterium]|nr:hypothetical protein [Elusimicrobiota bacterium]